MFRRKDLLKKVKWQDEGAVMRSPNPHGRDAYASQDLVASESYGGEWYDELPQQEAYYAADAGYGDSVASEGEWYEAPAAGHDAVDALDTLMGAAAEPVRYVPSAPERPRQAYQTPVYAAPAPIAQEPRHSLFAEQPVPARHEQVRPEPVQHESAGASPRSERSEVQEAYPGDEAPFYAAHNQAGQPSVREAFHHKPNSAEAKATLAEQFAKHTEHMLLRKLVKPVKAEQENSIELMAVSAPVKAKKEASASPQARQEKAPVKTVAETPKAQSSAAVEKTQVEEVSVIKPVKEGESMSRTAQIQDRSNSAKRTLTVGQETFLKGEITNCDHVIIEGSIDASMTDVRSLEIAINGLYRGTAVVDHAEISGEFDGELEVRGRLRIHTQGKVTGKVSFRELEVSRGGQLLGHISLLDGETAEFEETIDEEVEEIAEFRKTA